MSLFEDMNLPPVPFAPWQIHSLTSQEAAASMKPHLSYTKGKVMKALRDYAMTGLTAQQIQIVTELSGDTVRPRLVELHNEGLIAKAGQRETKSGRMADCWVIVRDE